MKIGQMNLENLLYGVQQKMNKLEELKQYVSKLFESATEKSIIEQSAVVSSKIDEIASEQKKQEDDYNALLKDYKDVVIHSSFKPLDKSDTGAKLPSANYQTFDDIFDNAIKHAMEDNKNKPQGD